MREWSRAGHEVVVFTQERHPEAYDIGGAEVVRPDIGGLLPVFVLDRYEGLEPQLLQEYGAASRRMAEEWTPDRGAEKLVRVLSSLNGSR